jgi:hypothetical protein
MSYFKQVLPARCAGIYYFMKTSSSKRHATWAHPIVRPLSFLQEAHAARLAALEHGEAGEEGAAAGPTLRERLQEAEQARAALQQEVDRLTAQLHSGRHGPPAVQVRGRDTQTDGILLETRTSSHSAGEVPSTGIPP